jgi:hypothetical protein
MLDQIFGQMFASQWIVFVALAILLVGVAELAWRMGLANSRGKSEGDKDSGTVRSAVLALLGLLLGFSFAIAAARTRRAASFSLKRQTLSARLRAGRSCCPHCREPMGL